VKVLINPSDSARQIISKSNNGLNAEFRLLWLDCMEVWSIDILGVIYGCTVQNNADIIDGVSKKYGSLYLQTSVKLKNISPKRDDFVNGNYFLVWDIQDDVAV